MSFRSNYMVETTTYQSTLSHAVFPLEDRDLQGIK